MAAPSTPSTPRAAQKSLLAFFSRQPKKEPVDAMGPGPSVPAAPPVEAGPKRSRSPSPPPRPLASPMKIEPTSVVKPEPTSVVKPEPVAMGEPESRPAAPQHTPKRARRATALILDDDMHTASEHSDSDCYVPESEEDSPPARRSTRLTGRRAAGAAPAATATPRRDSASAESGHLGIHSGLAATPQRPSGPLAAFASPSAAPDTTPSRAPVWTPSRTPGGGLARPLFAPGSPGFMEPDTPSGGGGGGGGGGDSLRYAFLQNPLDARRRPRDHPDYDPKTLYIPPEVMRTFKPFEAQYWKIKCQYFDTLLFYKKGFFYELYEGDADIGVQELDLTYTRMARAGEMKCAGFPTSKVEEWTAKALARGYRVARVDEMESGLAKSLRAREAGQPPGGTPSGSQSTVLGRGLTQIATPGTLVHSELLLQGAAPRFCASICQATVPGPGGAGSVTAFGVVLLDASTGQFRVGLIREEDDTAAEDPHAGPGAGGVASGGMCIGAADCARLETLLVQTRPREIVYPRGRLDRTALRAIRAAAARVGGGSTGARYGSNVLTALEPGSEFWDAAATEAELDMYLAPGAGGASAGGPDASPLLQQLADSLDAAFDQFTAMETEQPGDKAAALGHGTGAPGSGRFLDRLPAEVAALLRAEPVVLSALGGLVWYLRRIRLDEDLLLQGRFSILQLADDLSHLEQPAGAGAGAGATTTATDQDSWPEAGSAATAPVLVLDGKTLLSLGVVDESPEAGEAAASAGRRALGSSFDPLTGVASSLHSLLDTTRTAGGARLLRDWLQYPPAVRSQIELRQDAVGQLLTGPGASGAEDLAAALAAVPDIERLVSRLQTAGGASGGSIGPKMFVDLVAGVEAMAQVGETLGRVVERLARAAADPAAVAEDPGLADVRAPPGLVPRLEALARVFHGARLRATVANVWRQVDRPAALAAAAATGTAAAAAGGLAPCAGSLPPYDQLAQSIGRLEAEVEALRRDVVRQLGAARDADVSFRSIGSDRFLLEISNSARLRNPGLLDRAPTGGAHTNSDFILVSKTSTLRRFLTPAVRDVSQRIAELEDRRAEVLRLFGARHAAFVTRRQARRAWLPAAEACAELDCLLALARASSPSGPMGPCVRPRFVPLTPAERRRPLAEAYVRVDRLRHPLMRAERFVPNSLALGRRPAGLAAALAAEGVSPPAGGNADQPGAADDDAHILLLTGPNMGGKSTLLRQVSLAVILAQVGARVPAEHMLLSRPLVRIFTRIGANDDIVAGRSTFMVEMSETARVLNRQRQPGPGAVSGSSPGSAALRANLLFPTSLRHPSAGPSLVILDELGRGTSTHDGYAVAYAVLRELLVRPAGSLVLFATHYHQLSAAFVQGPGAEQAARAPVRGIRACHMSYALHNGNLVFLHTLAAGPTEASFGLNVARMAGVPEGIIARAAEASRKLLPEGVAPGPSPSGGLGMVNPTSSPAPGPDVLETYHLADSVDLLRAVQGARAAADGTLDFQTANFLLRLQR
ncbi:hypothetical protein H696_02125 [Fonticula alba]|uniref:DNA mismatch repair proteins mutS family domain-containing protein n=1 Tax=Fonticula alba TaxID=691883 RepID=A0A058ZB76_FONAL|nr:hypothetical protein H696_02125 [Fonticula alba]KCV71173.1 hypothetical protein H696_02125 [Fonticula alba]|eukprot:XP_009494296.1 hypothetical protein H696_02125 [Fonticula alba]